MLVVGDAILDRYLTGRGTGLAREAPAPVVQVAERSDRPGGAANAAANLAALGARGSLLAVTGDDPEGVALRESLISAGVETALLSVEAGRRTLVKHRVVADGQLVLRFDEGDRRRVAARTEAAIGAVLRRTGGDYDAILISDYGYGVLTPGAVAALAAVRAASPGTLVVDARDLRPYRPLRPTAVKPNYAEATRLLGLEEAEGERARTGQIAGRAAELLARTGAALVAVTLDSDGALLLERENAPYRTYARRGTARQTAGAGDTFAATLTLALAAGATTPAAADIASAAAAMVSAEMGTSACHAEALRAALGAETKLLGEIGRLAAYAAEARRQGQRLVFTNGCFDILHRGHITYLNRAKALGDRLIVGVNADASVRRLKGAGRPVNSLVDRMEVLAALSCVDLIVPFAEETPHRLIEAIRPDLYVKGGDYRRETLPETAQVEALGGTVQILAYVEAQSSTGIIERIQRETMNAER